MSKRASCEAPPKAGGACAPPLQAGGARERAHTPALLGESFFGLLMFACSMVFISGWGGEGASTHSSSSGGVSCYSCSDIVFVVCYCIVY